MPLSNEELVRRADLALADLNSNGGILLPEQSNAFIDMVMEQPTILRQVRTVRLGAPERKINRLGFTSRIMRAAPQGSPPYAADDGTNDRYLLAADRSKPVTSQIAITTKEQMAEIRIPYEALEDNIEGQSFEQHVMRLIAQRAALDFEEWALFGDTGSGDAYLALQDGYLKRMTSHVVDNASAGPSPDMFTAGLLALPQKYLRDLGQMKHFVSMANTIKYRALVANRQTGYGDSMLTQGGPIFAAGVGVEGAPMLAAGGGGALGIFTFAQNLIWAIWRQIQVETDKDIRSREIIIVLTCRVGVQIEEEDACVKYINV
jgi:Phage capsid family